MIEVETEYLLGTVQPVTLSTTDYHIDLLVLNIPLTIAWVVYNLV
jgi:hypothetical protein